MKKPYSIPLLLGGVTTFIFIRRMIQMGKIQDTFKGEALPTIAVKQPTKEPKQYVGNMSAVHREEFISRMKAMSREEIEIVADLLPIELCFDRIKRELDKSKQFEASIKAAMNGLG